MISIRCCISFLTASDRSCNQRSPTGVDAADIPEIEGFSWTSLQGRGKAQNSSGRGGWRSCCRGIYIHTRKALKSHNLWKENLAIVAERRSCQRHLCGFSTVDKIHRLTQVDFIWSEFAFMLTCLIMFRAQWLKSPTWEVDNVYDNVAMVFRMWSHSQVSSFLRYIPPSVAVCLSLCSTSNERNSTLCLSLAKKVVPVQRWKLAKLL